MRRKLKIINKKRFYVALILLLLIFISIFVVTVYAFEDNSISKPVNEYVVSPGDTLWDIAGEFKGEKDIRTYLYQLKKLNDLDSSYISIGMKLRLP